MDSVIMTSPGNSSRLRSRLRSAANTICARSSKPKTFVAHHRVQANGGNLISKTSRNPLQRNNSTGSVHRPLHYKHQNTVELKTFDSNDNATGALSQPLAFVAGKLGREAYNVWCGHLGQIRSHLPADQILAICNDMHIYPSKNQVHEMLQCARGGVGHFLTFGEFCVFAGELRRYAQQSRKCLETSPDNANINNSKRSKYEVFLGGSCNPTTWRADVAIPTLTNFGISYYNPQVSTWSPELLVVEHEAKTSADVLLFVLDKQTRCVAGMIEVAQLSAQQRCLVVVAHRYQPRQVISNEQISYQEFVDLWQGQNTLLALIGRDITPVFSDLAPALQCVARLLRESNSENQSSQLILHEKLDQIRAAFNSLDQNRTGALTLSEICTAYHSVTNATLTVNDLKLILRNNGYTNVDDVRITLEQFYSICAEFGNVNKNLNSNTRTIWTTPSIATMVTSDNGGQNIRVATVSRVFHWKLVLLRTQQLIRIYIFKPIFSVLEWIQRQVSLSNNNSDVPLYQPNLAIQQSMQRRHIYLGGSCMRRTTWRQTIAIPLLNKYGLTYYNPSLHEKIISDLICTNSSINNCNNLLNSKFTNDGSNGQLTYSEVDDVDERLVDNEHVLVENIKNMCDIHTYVDRDVEMMAHCDCLLFVITKETRSIAPMMLAAYCVGAKKNMVLCIQYMEEGCTIGKEKLTKYAIKDYNRSRTYLSDMAKREGIPVFDCIQDAVQCAIQSNYNMNEK